MEVKESEIRAVFLQVLIKAIKAGDIEELRQLCGFAEAVVTTPETATGMTALHYAAGLGARAMVRILMATDEFDLALEDKWGRTAPALAVEVADDPVLGRYLYDKLHEQKARAAAS